MFEEAFISQVFEEPLAGSEYHPANTIVHLRVIDQAAAAMRQLSRRAHLQGIAALGTAIFGAAQETVHKSPFDAPQFQEIAGALRQYLSELATQWARSTNPQERAALPFVRAMAEHPEQTI